MAILSLPLLFTSVQCSCFRVVSDLLLSSVSVWHTFSTGQVNAARDGDCCPGRATESEEHGVPFSPHSSNHHSIQFSIPDQWATFGPFDLWVSPCSSGHVVGSLSSSSSTSVGFVFNPHLILVPFIPSCTANLESLLASSIFGRRE